MWEELKIYKQLDRKDINPMFKKLGHALASHLVDYSIDQTTSVIKLYRVVNQLEQAIFIAKDRGSFSLKIRTSIKPVDYHRRHKFTMLNIVSLGDIMNNHRMTNYPLTQEWNDLAVFLTKRINTEIEQYFQKYDSYDKIIGKQNEIELNNFSIDNKYELLIYAAIRTKNISILNLYLDIKLNSPTMQISQSEYLKPDSQEINEHDFLQRIKTHAQIGDFASIEEEIAIITKHK